MHLRFLFYIIVLSSEYSTTRETTQPDKRSISIRFIVLLVDLLVRLLTASTIYYPVYRRPLPLLHKQTERKRKRQSSQSTKNHLSRSEPHSTEVQYFYEKGSFLSFFLSIFLSSAATNQPCLRNNSTMTAMRSRRRMM